MDNHIVVLGGYIAEKIFVLGCTSSLNDAARIINSAKCDYIIVEIWKSDKLLISTEFTTGFEVTAKFLKYKLKTSLQHIRI